MDLRPGVDYNCCGSNDKSFQKDSICGRNAQDPYVLPFVRCNLSRHCGRCPDQLGVAFDRSALIIIAVLNSILEQFSAIFLVPAILSALNPSKH